MRTTIDLPDDLYRSLKARAALNGVPMRELVRHLIEQGLRSPTPSPQKPGGRRDPPPVIVPPRGELIPALSRSELTRLEEAEDEARHAGFTRR